jgi:hypothetical protein
MCRQLGAMEGACQLDKMRCNYYLVAPKSISVIRGKLGVESVYSFFPHVSFEDPPASLDDAALVIYQLDITTVCG